VTVSNPNLSAELHSLYRALAAAGCEVEIEPSQVRLWPMQPREPVCWRVPGDKPELVRDVLREILLGADGSRL
jgi:hypothetical protein